MTTYARAGVQGYWLVDPDQRAGEQYVLEGDTYRLAARATGHQSLTSAPLGGLVVDLSTVWE